MISRRMTLGGLMALGGCSSVTRNLSTPPSLSVMTKSMRDLLELPSPKNRLDTAVFAFLDQTGQHKPNQNYADYSLAVTQGAVALLIKSMHDAGSGRWFRVLERNRISDVLQERQIIRANRIEYSGPDGKSLPPLAPLLNAGIIMEGGIIAYDSDVITGGFGANYLGIGGNVQYRKDTVGVSLRTVSTLSGEVLTNVESNKTVYSVQIDGSIFKYVGFNKLLQIESGLSMNEPVTLCVNEAIELAVYATIIEGTMKGYWEFADQERQKLLIDDYLTTRGGSPQLVPTVKPA